MSRNSEVITVVFPIYNKQKTVKSSLISVLDQTVKPYELIVVDDGSTDNSLSIAESVLSAASIRYQIVRQRNSGVAVARNKGVELSSTDIIAFLDADDEWDHDFIRKMSSLVEKYPYGVLYSCSHRIRNSYGVRDKVSNVFTELEDGVINSFFYVYSKTSLVNSSKVLVRKDVFDLVGGFPEGVSINEDVFLWIQLSLAGPVVYRQEDLVTVNQFEDSSRIGRRGKVPYIIEYYSGRKSEVSDQLGLKDLIWRICYSHVFQSFALEGKRNAWAIVRKSFLIFPFRSLFFIVLFFVPSGISRYLFLLRKRVGFSA
ncbi:MAG: glycosyltransferase family A protein [Pseudomonas profundi]|uniref:glycosyltransferase family 2 protein n=1 Tax=Pseudomonas profundi TaxID=1981513 RepID=UPI0030019F6E